MNARKYAQAIMKQEAEAILAMADRLDDRFAEAVKAIRDCKGKVIVTGMGKSGLIGRKIAATLNSTGISSFFLHPAEAVHGDLGVIRTEDVLMIISKSGQLDELEAIVAVAKRLGTAIVVLGGNQNAGLYQKADIALDCSVDSEAGPMNLVPTSSTTAALVMGDALALALVESRGFTSEDFAVLHPGGSLGQRLLKHVFEVHHTGEDMPLVAADAPLTEVLLAMTSKRLGCVMMKGPNGEAAGIFTDGDLRRLIEQKKDVFSLKAVDVMIKNPKSISERAILDAALAMMERYAITQLPTVNAENKLAGILHLHDILKSKLV
jgi:arabinose-5-phosphate isomerase